MPLHVYRVKTHSGILLGLLNPSHDTAGPLVMRLPRGQLDLAQAMMLADDGNWRPVQLDVQDIGQTQRVTIPVTLTTLDGCFLLCPEAAAG